LSIELFVSCRRADEEWKEETYTNDDRCHISLSPRYHPYQQVIYKLGIDPLPALRMEVISEPRDLEGVSAVDFG